MPGLARSNSGSSAVTTSPSRPMAQNRRTISGADARPQPAAISSAAKTPRTTGLDSVGRELLTRSEPATREASLLEAAPQVRVLAHHAPDELGPIGLHHGEHRPLVDTEIVAGHPAEARDVATMPEGDIEEEAPVERVDKAVLRVNVPAEAAVQAEGRRHNQLWPKRHGRHHRRWRKRAVVGLAGGIDAAGHVTAKRA